MLFLVLTSLCLIATSTASNPGYKLRATKPGLNYASKLGGQEITNLIKSIDIPPLSFSSGILSVNLKGIRLNQFSAQTWTYGLQPPSRLTYSMAGASLAASGDFDGKVNIPVFPISVDGHIEASSSGTLLSVTAQFARDNQGRPTISAVGCQCDLGDFNIKLSGNIVADFLSLFHSLIEGEVKPIISQQICEQGKTAINQNLAQLLQSLPTSIDVAGGFSIDYTLTSDPVVGADFVEVQGRGDIKYKGQPPQGIATPLIDESGVDNSKMLNFWGTEYILNTFGYQAQKADVIEINVDKDSVPEAKAYLATTCSALCVGTIIKEIGKDYPNTYTQMRVASTASPVSRITSNNITVSATGTLDLSVENGTDVEPLASAALKMEASLIPGFSNGPKITGKVVITKLDITQTSSTLSDPIPWMFLGKLSQNILQNEINKLLKPGIPIPLIPDLQITNPAVALFENTLQLDADVNYNV